MNKATVRYLSYSDIEKIGLPMQDIIGAVDEMFVEKGKGKVEMPPKPGIHTRPDSFIHAMPAYIPSLEAAGMKWVSGYPANQAKGLPYISGLLILNDPDTGVPLAIMDCTWITAKRTGAATAVAAKYLARPESSRTGILACGVQGRSNLEALACVFPLKRVKAFDVVPAISESFAREMSEKLELDVEPVGSPEQAVRDQDMIVTSGPILKTPDPVIPPGWLEEGTFACPVDFDSYWTGDALRQADRIVTDDLAQFHHYREVGYFQDTPEPVADLGEIAAGKKQGRQSEKERTIAINLGLALEDMAVAVRIYRRAIAENIGIELQL